jgi:hypothetical protein
MRSSTDGMKLKEAADVIRQLATELDHAYCGMETVPDLHVAKVAWERAVRFLTTLED